MVYFDGCGEVVEFVRGVIAYPFSCFLTGKGPGD